jgi:chemotaxis protein CheD
MERVGIGHFRVLKQHGMLTAYGLGSCIGLFLYEASEKIGGLAHIMLPGARPENAGVLQTRYAEDAFELMLQEMTGGGASLRRIGAMVVGGAHMFRDVYDNIEQTIGYKNQQSVMEILRRRNIAVVAQDLGGVIGRTMQADVGTGAVTVRSFGREPQLFHWNASY